MAAVLPSRVIALLVAYALAMQGILAALALPAAAAGPLSVLCLGTADATPVGHDPNSTCPESCAMPGCGTGLVPARAHDVPQPVQWHSAEPPSMARAARDRIVFRGPQAARAPPLV
jgi:hypothetical protein